MVSQGVEKAGSSRKEEEEGGQGVVSWGFWAGGRVPPAHRLPGAKRARMSIEVL